jgi:hypothetical protein
MRRQANQLAYPKTALKPLPAYMVGKFFFKSSEKKIVFSTEKYIFETTTF